jgi:hypothetical protein
MKKLLLTLLLVNNLQAQEQAAPAADKHPPINHIFQGRGNRFCGTASALMAVQAVTNIKLDGQDLLDSFSGIYNAAAATGKSDTSSHFLSYIFGLSPKLYNYNTDGLTDITARQLAFDKLKNNIIPELDAGSVVTMTIRSEIERPESRHIVLLSRYDHGKQVFTVNDPLFERPLEVSLDTLAKKWPVYDGPTLYIFASAVRLNIESIAKSNLRYPPNILELNLAPNALGIFALADSVSIPRSFDEYLKDRFAIVIKDALIIPVSISWEKGRKVDDVKGIALWLKVKIAQGDPACLFFSKPDGSKKIVAVTGYRGGYKNFEGEMQITEIGEDGKLVKSWMKSAEVLQKGKSPRDCGGDSFYIIYPIKPLVEHKVAETKDDSK